MPGPVRERDGPGLRGAAPPRSQVPSRAQRLCVHAWVPQAAQRLPSSASRSAHWLLISQICSPNYSWAGASQQDHSQTSFGSLWIYKMLIIEH